MRVVGTGDFAVTEDFSDVQVRLRTDRSEDLQLEMNVAVLEDLLLKINKLLHMARREAHAAGVNPAVYPARVIDAAVQGAAGTGLVSLSLQTEDELVQYYALPANLSERLRTNMSKAEAIAVSQSSPARQ